MTELVSGPGAWVRAELRAAGAMWRREMTHVLRDRVRTAVGLVQPLLFLFVLGVGLAGLFSASGTTGPGPGYVLFLFPGVLVMAVQSPALAAGASVVVDRDSGFLREMLVAPVGRVTLLLAKCAGGASVATAQGAVILAFAGFTGLPADPVLFAALLVELALIALTVTAFGTLAAVLIRRMQTFNTFLTVVMTPSLFLSGMMFPVQALPPGLRELALINPLTYGVDVLRRTITAHAPGGSSALFEPVSWYGWTPSVPVELLCLAALTAACLLIASRNFSRID